MSGEVQNLLGGVVKSQKYSELDIGGRETCFQFMLHLIENVSVCAFLEAQTSRNIFSENITGAGDAKRRKNRHRKLKSKNLYFNFLCPIFFCNTT